jgi:hypothetical protein
LPRDNPFFELPLFRKTRDGRHVVSLNIYPGLQARALNFLRCSNSSESIGNAVLQWRAEELEAAAAEAGLVFAMVRTNEEFRSELQYTEVLSRMPLITLEKIGESEPVPLERGAKSPLAGLRAFGLGHVIAGAGIGRDLAYYGADVLNIWRPNDAEIEAFAWDVQVGMRSTLLDGSKEDRATFDRLLKNADVFFSNRRRGVGLVYHRGDTHSTQVAGHHSDLRQRGWLARHCRCSRGPATARQRRRKLSRRRIPDQNRAVAALNGHIR